MNIPIFPLHSVLFPEGPLPLKIFEPRYTDMISQCLKSNTDFGICLIREGEEVGSVASTHEVGTLAKIIDWHMRQDGILGVVVQGQKRFRIVDHSVSKNQLLYADVEFIENETQTKVPSEYFQLIDLLQSQLVDSSAPYDNKENNFSDATWVGFRLAELLPLRLSQKQYFLQLNEPLLRLERINDVLQHLEI